MVALFLCFVMLSGIFSAVLSQTTLTGIPLNRSGYNYIAGDQSSPVTVQMVIDLTCSATADAWNTLSAVVSQYSDSVRFRIKILPLPYHQFAFLVSKAASVVYYFEGDQEAFKFMNKAIINQSEILNSATSDKTYNQVKEMVKGWATNATTVSPHNFEEGFDVNTDAGKTIEMFTRYEFKTAAIEGNFGTPMYTINNLLMTGLDNFPQWQETLDPLLAKRKQLEADPSIIYL